MSTTYQYPRPFVSSIQPKTGCKASCLKWSIIHCLCYGYQSSHYKIHNFYSDHGLTYLYNPFYCKWHMSIHVNSSCGFFSADYISILGMLKGISSAETIISNIGNIKPVALALEVFRITLVKSIRQLVSQSVIHQKILLNTRIFSSNLLEAFLLLLTHFIPCQNG